MCINNIRKEKEEEEEEKEEEEEEKEEEEEEEEKEEERRGGMMCYTKFPPARALLRGTETSASSLEATDVKLSNSSFPCSSWITNEYDHKAKQ